MTSAGGELEGAIAREGEGEGELAAFFNSRASSFISRSKAREEAVRGLIPWDHRYLFLDFCSGGGC